MWKESLRGSTPCDLWTRRCKQNPGVVGKCASCTGILTSSVPNSPVVPLNLRSFLSHPPYGSLKLPIHRIRAMGDAFAALGWEWEGYGYKRRNCYGRLLQENVIWNVMKDCVFLGDVCEFISYFSCFMCLFCGFLILFVILYCFYGLFLVFLLRRHNSNRFLRAICRFLRTISLFSSPGTYSRSPFTDLFLLFLLRSPGQPSTTLS